MSYAIRIHAPGSPEQLCWEESCPGLLWRTRDDPMIDCHEVPQ